MPFKIFYNLKRFSWITCCHAGVFSIYVVLFLLFMNGCVPFLKSKNTKDSTSYNKFQKQAAAAGIEEPKLLITAYRDMKQDDAVSWVWLKPSFQLSDCRSVEVLPVLNYSSFKYHWAEEKIYTGLKKIFTSENKKDTGSIDAEVTAAIIDMKPKKKLIARLTPFEEDTTSIEMQMIIVDKNSKSIVCKIAHGRRSEDFKDSVDLMIKDIEQFCKKDMISHDKTQGTR